MKLGRELRRTEGGRPSGSSWTAKCPYERVACINAAAPAAFLSSSRAWSYPAGGGARRGSRRNAPREVEKLTPGLVDRGGVAEIGIVELSDVRVVEHSRARTG